MGKAVHRDPLDAMGNAQRRAIVELLASGPRSVQEIADTLPISRPAVSRHLKVLSEAGLVRDDRAGTRRLYQLNGLGAREIESYLRRVWGDAAGRFKLFAENTRP